MSALLDAFDHARHVYRSDDQIVELVGRYDAAAMAVNQAVFAVQISALLESQADHLADSLFARVVTFLPAPGALRAAAREWQARSDAHFREAAAEATG